MYILISIVQKHHPKQLRGPLPRYPTTDILLHHYPSAFLPGSTKLWKMSNKFTWIPGVTSRIRYIQHHIPHKWTETEQEMSNSAGEGFFFWLLTQQSTQVTCLCRGRRKNLGYVWPAVWAWPLCQGGVGSNIYLGVTTLKLYRDIAWHFSDNDIHDSKTMFGY